MKTPAWLEKALAGGRGGSALFPPSLFIALALGSSIACASSMAVEGVPGAASIVMAAMAAASFPALYLGSLRVAADPGAPFRERGAARALVLLVMAAGLAAATGARVYARLADVPAPLGEGRHAALVDSVSERRYWREVRALVARPGGRPERLLAKVSGGGAIERGDRLEFTGAPVPASDPRCGPAAYRRSLLLDGIRHVAWLDGATVAVTAGGGSLRDRARAGLARNCDLLFNRETAAVVKAFYFGSQDRIDKITMNDFKRAGVLHVLSASGLHVAVVAAVPLFLLGLLRAGRKATIMSAAAVVALYLFMTDMPVSLFRACLMFFIFAAERVMDRKGSAINALFLSAAAILLLFPGELFSLGFQLSFGATLGILLFHAPYRASLSWLPGPAAGPLAVTLSAQALVLPLLLVQVGEVNLTGFVSNMVVVPLMSLLLVASLAANALSCVTDAAYWAGRACDLLYLASRWLVGHLSALEGHFTVAYAGPLLACAFFLLLVPVLPRVAGKKPASLALIAALLLAWLSLDAGASARDQVTVARHGRGTLLIVKEGMDVALMGQAPEPRHRDRVVREVMAAGCREVTLVIHRPDYGTVSGYAGLARRLPVRRCCLGGDYKIRGYTRRFFNLLGADGAELVIDEEVPGGGGRAGRLRLLHEQYTTGNPVLGRVPGKIYGVRYLTLH